MSVENHLKALRTKHENIEKEITALEHSPSADTLEITDLKKRKLLIKEDIMRIEGELV